MTNYAVIKNGLVLDPSAGINGKHDLVIKDGKTTEIGLAGSIGQNIQSATCIDATDCLVVPGLIDIHTHVFQGATETGIQADLIGVDQGVTTVVDAGSAGANTFAKFVAEVVDKSSTRVLVWLNISSEGLCAGRTELKDLTKLEIGSTVDLIRQYPIIRGIKVRMSSSILGNSGLKPLEIAKKAAREARVPLLVHVGNGPPALGEILDLLDMGDIVTHAFHGKPGGIINDRGELIPQAERALKRGVRFDVGHGTESFSFRTMMRSKAAGVGLSTISTDLYLGNYHGPVCSLSLTLAKFLALGYTLEQVIAAATSEAAKTLGLSDKLGTLAKGRVADISILKLQQGEFDFIDSEKNHLVGQQLLQPIYAIRAGAVFRCK